MASYKTRVQLLHSITRYGVGSPMNPNRSICNTGRFLEGVISLREQYRHLPIACCAVLQGMRNYTTHLSSVKENTFTVRRTDPILIIPAEPTPYQFKSLSDIDDQDGVRFYAPIIHLYKGDPSKEGQDPVR
jgi:hypothetical protein